MNFKALAPIVLIAVTLAACGSASSSARDTSDPPASAAGGNARTPSPTARGPVVKVIDSDFGRILGDRRGRALYLFTADHGESVCAGACARAWPPYIVKSAPGAGRGAKPGLAGATRRADGRLQATYAGHPLYYYVGDRPPGEVTCQAVFEFGGYWYVVRASGKAVR